MCQVRTRLYKKVLRWSSSTLCVKKIASYLSSVPYCLVCTCESSIVTI